MLTHSVRWQPQARQHDPDGGPTDNGEFKARPPAKKAPPRASQQVQSGIYTVKIEPYMFGRCAFAAAHIVSDYSLILNCCSQPKLWHIAIRRHDPGEESEDVGDFIRAEHLHHIEWSILADDTRRPFVFLQFNSGKGKKIVDQLTADCEKGESRSLFNSLAALICLELRRG
jgi:hypothetical protein